VTLCFVFAQQTRVISAVSAVIIKYYILYKFCQLSEYDWSHNGEKGANRSGHFFFTILDIY